MTALVQVGPSPVGGGPVPSLDTLRSLPYGATRRSYITHRERQVLVLAANGNTNNDIGIALGIDKETVKTHVRRVLRKLQASDRTQAVAVAQLLGLISDADIRIPGDVAYVLGSPRGEVA